MEAYSQSISKEMSASASGGGFGVSASIEASYSCANSSAMQSSHSAKSEGKTKQMSTSAIATLYTFALREGEEQEFLAENFKADLASVVDQKSAFKFIKLYGSHYLSRAKMGARFQENIYFSEEAT